MMPSVYLDILGTCWGYLGDILVLSWGYLGAILGLSWGYIRDFFKEIPKLWDILMIFWGAFGDILILSKIVRIKFTKFTPMFW